MRRRTNRGDRLLADLEVLFRGARQRASAGALDVSTGERALLAAVFGTVAVAGLPGLASAVHLFRSTGAVQSGGSGWSWSSSSSSSSSDGGGCGGASCGGGGCGGGCGGCGG